MPARILTVLLLAVILLASGCRPAGKTSIPPPVNSDPDSNQTRLSYGIQAEHEVEDLPIKVVQFESVFWEPRDTESLRKLIRKSTLVQDKRIMEIGTGTGLVALCCLQHGAKEVVATDINAAAIANAAFNAERMNVEIRLDTRLVSHQKPAAYAALREGERFDLILSNPPWEDGTPDTIDQFAFYDPNFALLRSLLAGARQHLKPGGKLLLAYGCVEAIRIIETLAPAFQLSVRRLDERKLDDLPEVFLPGMLLELKTQ